MAGEPVNEIVLGAVGLVGDHHDVPPLGQDGVAIAFLLGKELLNSREYDAARFDRELLSQVRPAFGLDRRLAQEVLAARERAKELAVQVVSVGEDHDGGIG